MTTVMKIQLNMYINKEINTSASFEHIVIDETDAEELGEHDAKLLTAYMNGYGKGTND